MAVAFVRAFFIFSGEDVRGPLRAAEGCCASALKSGVIAVRVMLPYGR